MNVSIAAPPTSLGQKVWKSTCMIMEDLDTPGISSFSACQDWWEERWGKTVSVCKVVVLPGIWSLFGASVCECTPLLQTTRYYRYRTSYMYQCTGTQMRKGMHWVMTMYTTECNLLAGASTHSCREAFKIAQANYWFQICLTVLYSLLLAS